MVLLERDTYLAELERLLLEAAAGHGRLVFVGGEAGVGKTTFVSRVADSARKTARVLVGACDPMSTPRPLSPVLDIAATVGGTLERLLGDAAQPRHRILRGILAELSGGLRPTLAVFEDAHWADEATLDLLRFVGRRCGSTRLLLIVTYRDDEVGPTHPLRVVLGDLATTAPVRRLSLPCLTEAAVRRLAEGSPLDPVELYRRTAGNPFFATEALASGSDAIPATVRDAVLARASRLTKAGRATLDAAAVIGAHGEAWLLAEVAGRDAPAVRDCVAAGVLRVDGEGFTFRHELARDAILESLPTARQLALHRRALEALRSRTPTTPDTLARLAHHAEGAADAPAVLEYAMAAARRASTLHAHRQARAQYARARRFADTLAPVDRAGLLEAYAYECHLTEAVDDAIAARQEALRIWRERGDDLRVGNALGRLAGCFWYAGRNAEAEAAAQGALDILEALPPGPELAMAYSTQAELRMLARDADAAIRWSEKAIELADRLGDRETLAHALNNLGSARLVSGVEGGWQALARSIRIAADADLEDHVARGYTNLGSGHGEVYEFTRADLFLSEGIAYCTERDLDHLRALHDRVARPLPLLPGPAGRRRPSSPPGFSVRPIWRRRRASWRWSRSRESGSGAAIPRPSRSSTRRSPWPDARTRSSAWSPSTWPGPRRRGSRGTRVARRRKPAPSTPAPSTASIPGSRGLSPTGAGEPATSPRRHRGSAAPSRSRSRDGGGRPRRSGRRGPAPTRPPRAAPPATTPTRSASPWRTSSDWGPARRRRA